MSRTFSLNQLTEGIRDRHVGQEASRIQEKWTRTGLLRGLQEHNRENMARLLENQAAQVLRESNTLGGSAGGNIEGFSNIAFPIVRRVFGGLVANELVSIQPMSLPSGLLFYLDYTYGSDVGGSTTADGDGNLTAANGSTYNQGDSIYNNPTGRDIRTGSTATGGQFDLVGTSYTQIHETAVDLSGLSLASGSFGTGAAQVLADGVAMTSAAGADGKLLQFDPQVSTALENGEKFTAIILDADSTNFADMDTTAIKSFTLTSAQSSHAGLSIPGSSYQPGSDVYNIRRLNQLGTWDNDVFTPNPFVSVGTGDATNNAAILVIAKGEITSGVSAADLALNLTGSFVKSDAVSTIDGAGAGATLVVPSFESDMSATVPEPVIPEIDIKIESIAVTATTRKLRARWSPEMAQDLNAYHSMDAEVELTQILSEQIALEIDREILNDLLVQAQGANFYWDRRPGRFVNKRTGVDQTNGGAATSPVFTGTVREWYETLVETIIDVANEIHRKTLRGSANFIVVSPEVATIFESSVLYKPSIKIDGQGQTSIAGIGAEAVGSLSNRFTVYKDPYFPRNKILVGYKGGSYLESGYVYAPYVPLIVTPTIFAPEDFTPRKGVMTRYGKKMVRADFYGTVTCLGMDVI
jgi:hypothetical protein